jgi:hypothetical protein
LIAEITGGVAIVASLIILIAEIRNTGDAIREQTIVAQRNQDSEIRNRIIENRGGLGDLVLRERDGAPLTPAEQARVFLFFADAFNILEWQYRQVTLGRLTEADINPRLWRGLMQTEISRRAFESSKESWDPAFVQYVEQTIMISP